MILKHKNIANRYSKTKYNIEKLYWFKYKQNIVEVKTYLSKESHFTVR